MPALPTVDRQRAEPNRQYVAMASRLPLKSYRHVPAVLRDTLRIRRQLAASPGLVSYALNADLVHKTFWTFSVWDDADSLGRFARSDPHRRIVEKMQPRMAATGFATVRVDGAHVPGRWTEIKALLDDVDGRQP